MLTRHNERRRQRYRAKADAKAEQFTALEEGAAAGPAADAQRAEEAEEEYAAAAAVEEEPGPPPGSLLLEALRPAATPRAGSVEPAGLSLAELRALEVAGLRQREHLVSLGADGSEETLMLRAAEVAGTALATMVSLSTGAM